VNYTIRDLLQRSGQRRLYDIVQHNEVLVLNLCIITIFYEEMKPDVYIFDKIYAYWGSK
jgi:hypothetical protein